MTATPDEDVLDVAAMSPQELRDQAAYERVIAAERPADARQYRSMAEGESREAGQREHEATLLDTAAAALGALEAARSLLPGLEAAEEGAEVAEQMAVRRLRKDKKDKSRLARKEDQLSQANASVDLQAEAAVRATKAREVAARSERDRESARQEHEEAERVHEAQLALVGRLEIAYTNAVRAAQHPGQAAPGPFTVADMTDDERQGLTLAVLLAAGRDKPEPPRPSPGEALRDATRFRAIRGANAMVVMPPAASGGRP